jgi:hypothetical protein
MPKTSHGMRCREIATCEAHSLPNTMGTLPAISPVCCVVLLTEEYSTALLHHFGVPMKLANIAVFLLVTASDGHFDIKSCLHLQIGP